MNFQQFLRFAVGLLFQPMVMYYKKDDYKTYSNQLFYLPCIICVDGFSISIQVNYGNYCSTENGYRAFGWEWKTAEWGFPSEHEPLLLSDSENDETTLSSVGSSTIELLQQVFDSHGGIDWERTTSKENFSNLYKQ